MLDKDISQEDAKMPVPTLHFPTARGQLPTARGLTSALLLLALAGCSSRVIHEEPPPSLPGGGTYTWASGGIEPLPGVPETAPGEAGSDTIRAAIDNGLVNRGYEPRPEAEASWRVSYRSGQETRKEKLVPKDRLLQPRMVCGPHDCRITHTFVHFGPPHFAENPEYAITENVVQVWIHEVKSGHLIWQGSVASEVAANGQADNEVLRQKMSRLMRELPSVRPRSAKKTDNAAPAAAPPSASPQ